MPPNTLIKDDHRMIVRDEPDRLIEIDQGDGTADGWINVLRISTESVQAVIDTLNDGDLFIERVRYEANKQPLPETVKEVADRLPSFQDLLRDRRVVIAKGGYGVQIFPWTDDEGWTQFAVDLGRTSEEVQSEVYAQLGGSWQIRIAISLLREAMKMIENK